MTSAQRPSVETVVKMVASILAGRKFEGLRIDKVEFVFFPSAYNLTLSWDKRTIVLKIPAELVEEVVAGGDLFQKRKIKKMIKQAFGVEGEE